METQLFNWFKYVVGNSFTYKNKRQVKVFFIYKGKDSIILPLMIKKNKSNNEEQYYVDKAEKIIDRMIKNGSLEKYTRKYLKNITKKKILATSISLVSACAIAVISFELYSMYVRLTAPPPSYDVTCTSGVTPTNSTAVQDKKYVTNLTTENGVILPEQINRVTINEEELLDYTYSKTTDTSAVFSIDAQYVTGPIDIDLGLNYVVTVTNGVTLKEGTELAPSNKFYQTELTVDNGSILPNTLTNVTVGGTPLTTGYYYHLESGSKTKAKFSINPQFVTGPINIGLNYGYQVTVPNGVTLAPGTQTAIRNEFYQTELTVGNGIVLPNNVTKVTISDVESPNYTYRKISDDLATFSIVAQYVTGSIDIELNYEYQVTVSDGVTLASGTQTAMPNEQYDTTLMVNNGTILPNSITKVTINGVESSDYTYNKTSSTEAKFSIGAQYVTGPIDIELNYGYQVRVPEGVILKEGTELATPDKYYQTELTVSDGTVLPNTLTSVTVNGAPLTTGYRYNLESGSTNKATFSIVAHCVTGPIDIDLNYGYKVTAPDGVTFKEGTELAMPNEFYYTTLKANSRLALPNSITKVTINGVESFNYTYNKTSDTLATFLIEPQYVTGPIDIDLGLNYFVNVTNGVTLKEGTEIAVHDANYITTLEVNDTTLLPNEVTSVKVNGIPLTTGYYYSLEGGSTKAYFSLDAKYVTGPIDIDLGLGYICTASLVAIGEEAITLSNTVVNTFEDYETTISFSDATYHDKNLPSRPFDVTSNGKSVYYTYTIDEIYRNKATLKIDKSLLTGDVVITLPALINKTKWYEFSNWWNYCSTQQGSIPIANKDTDVGQIVYAEVYGLMHQIRLIDVDHKGVDGVNPEAHCTFEFANVITDSSGAVTTEWDGTRTGNEDFANSTLNNFLNNDKDCVFTKLPEGLQNAIKLVNKKVATGETHTATTYPTKLFPLAHDEIGEHESSASKDEGTKYQYYIDHPNRTARIKYSVNSTDANTYWLRSPCTNNTMAVFYVDYYAGEIQTCPVIYGAAHTVAPAFCI